MADIMPFRAVRYNQRKGISLSKVVIPPYDVISPEEQIKFYHADPFNFVRLELNKIQKTDSSQENIYTRAAELLNDWLTKEILIRDKHPGFYINETTYTDVDGQTKTRKGFLSLLKADDFYSGVVLPHEKTFTKHKEDRFNLIKTVKANLSPIFALYSDEENYVQQVLEKAHRPKILADFLDNDGFRQKFWVVDDPKTCYSIQRILKNKTILIADGHHRYETALNYRNYMHKLYPKRGEKASFNFVMAYLCSMSDPGLTILPCHRMLSCLDGFNSHDFLALAKKYFNYEIISIKNNPMITRRILAEALVAAGKKRPAFGLASTESNSYYILSLKKGMEDKNPLQNIEPTLRMLDVAVLSELVLEHILGLDNITTDQIHRIKYASNMNNVLDEVASGRARAAFLMNPTKISQVVAVAQKKLIMPRKSTYFYPKVLAGLTINLILHKEDISTHLIS